MIFSTELENAVFYTLLKVEKIRMNAEDGSTCMCSCGFSVTEENTFLILCIAAGEKCPKIADFFFFIIAVNKSCPKDSQFFKQFSSM